MVFVESSKYLKPVYYNSFADEVVEIGYFNDKLNLFIPNMQNIYHAYGIGRATITKRANKYFLMKTIVSYHVKDVYKQLIYYINPTK